MNKYLVILDSNTGFTEIGNVAIVKASNEEEAKDKFISNTTFTDSIKNKLAVKDVDEVYEVWLYYN